MSLPAGTPLFCGTPELTESFDRVLLEQGNPWSRHPRTVGPDPGLTPRGPRSPHPRQPRMATICSRRTLWTHSLQGPPPISVLGSIPGTRRVGR